MESKITTLCWKCVELFKDAFEVIKLSGTPDKKCSYCGKAGEKVGHLEMVMIKKKGEKNEK